MMVFIINVVIGLILIILGGILMDKGKVKWVILIGGILFGFGFVLIGFVILMMMFYLFYGVFVGFG